MIRLDRSRIIVIGTLLSVLTALATAGTNTVDAQDRRPIIFEKPRSYFSADFSKHAGNLFLDPGRPAGVFVGYPAEGQDMAAFIDEVKDLVAKMFLHDAKDLVWSSDPLPSHKGVDSESGILMSTSTDKQDVQFVVYARADGVGYGYFAMRYNAGTPADQKCPDGGFLDAVGAGVPAFDEFANSIRTEPKQ